MFYMHIHTQTGIISAMGFFTQAGLKGRYSPKSHLNVHRIYVSSYSFVLYFLCFLVNIIITTYVQKNSISQEKQNTFILFLYSGQNFTFSKNATTKILVLRTVIMLYLLFFGAMNFYCKNN